MTTPWLGDKIQERQDSHGKCSGGLSGNAMSWDGVETTFRAAQGLVTVLIRCPSRHAL